jgi:uncharacterized iron-regulated membrane protein
MFRKIIFWIHLSIGVIAAAVVIMMSFTGVLLTYERQIISLVETGYHNEPPAGAERMLFKQFIDLTREYAPQSDPNTVIIENDVTAPIAVTLGRGRNVYINGYTGEMLGEGSESVKQFFSTLTNWHRWFDLKGKNRATGRAITGAANLMFLFLVFSGMYLWIPRRFKWPFIRGILFFNPIVDNSKARDFNWHNVFGIWSAIPLAIVIATATVFYYPWANDLVYQIVGEDPPGRSERGAGPGPGLAGNKDTNQIPAPINMDADQLFSIAANYLDDWNTISVRFPKENNQAMVFNIDQGNGGQPSKRHELSLSQQTGEIVKWAPYESQNPGRKLRVYIRYLHTGEALGIIGQTIAGLVSLTSIIMVWTGLALAYRRLIQPMFR